MSGLFGGPEVVYFRTKQLGSGAYQKMFCRKTNPARYSIGHGWREIFSGDAKEAEAVCTALSNLGYQREEVVFS